MDNKIKTAFTLIELLVVIAIIGILSGLIIVSMSGVTASATVAKSKVFSNSLRNALMLNLVSDWKFNENTGSTTVDSWSGGNTGTLTGPTHLPVWKTGNDCVEGSCLLLDGTEDYVDFGTGSNLIITSNLTVETWVKTTASNRRVMGKDNVLNTKGWTVWTDAFGIKVDVGNYWYGITSNKINSDWHHLAVTYIGDGTAPKFYIDGVSQTLTLTAVGDALHGFTDSGETLTVGRSHGFVASFNYFVGQIDGARIYNAAIPVSRIREQYYSGLNGLLSSGGMGAEEYRERIGQIDSLAGF